MNGFLCVTVVIYKNKQKKSAKVFKRISCVLLLSLSTWTKHKVK